MLQKLEIRNKENELLEAIAEGAKLEEADEIIIMVHGFGTSLHERGNFDDIAEEIVKKFPTKTIIRFTLSGFGNSEGKQEEKTFKTMVDETKVILNFIEEKINDNSKLTAITFSMGIHYFVKAVLEEDYSIKLMIIANPSEFDFKDRMKNYFKPKTKIDENGVWYLNRADGSVTKVGQAFWDAIDPIKQEENLTAIAKNQNSVLIRATKDHVVNNEKLVSLPFKKIIEIHGDHNYSKPEDLMVFVKKLIEVINDD